MHEKDIGRNIIELIQKDWLIICVCLLTILLVLVYAYGLHNYEETCNKYWADIIYDECTCSFMEVDNFTAEFDLTFIYKDESNNRDPDT